MRLKTCERRTMSNNSEKCILSIVLNDAGARHEVMRHVNKEDFLTPEYRTIWEHLTYLGDAGSMSTLIQSLTDSKHLDKVGGAMEVAEILTSAGGREHVEFHALEMLARSHRAKARRVAATLSEAITDDCDPSEVVASAMSALGAISAGKSSMPDIIEDTMAMVERLEEEMSPEGGDNHITTRWESMNQKMPIRRGSYMVIGGGTSSGKSLIATNLITDIINSGDAVAMFSYEMAKDDILKRLMSDKGNIEPGKLFTPKLTPPHARDFKGIMRVTEWLKSSRLTIFDDPTISADKLASIVRSLCIEDAPTAVVVDYIQLVPSHLSKETREMRVATISRTLRALALETGVAVIALTQLNDDGEVRESRAIKQDAEMLVTIDEDTLWVHKQRNGARNFPLYISQRDGMMEFEERTPPQFNR